MAISKPEQAAFDRMIRGTPVQWIGSEHQSTQLRVVDGSLCDGSLRSVNERYSAVEQNAGAAFEVDLAEKRAPGSRFTGRFRGVRLDTANRSVARVHHTRAGAELYHRVTGSSLQRRLLENRSK